MGEYSKRKEVIKLIKDLRNEYQIVDFIETNIPNELLADEEFINQLIEANPKVDYALEILNVEENTQNIKKDIEENGLEFVIQDEAKLDEIPKEYKDQLYEIAKKYEQNGEYRRARKIYEKVIEFGQGQVYKFNEKYGKEAKNKETIYYKSKYSYYMCKYKEVGDLTEEERSELENLVKQDIDNILGVKTPGKISGIEYALSCFEDVPIEYIETEILPKISKPRPRPDKKDEPGEIDPVGERREYIEELSPENRAEFIKNNFDISNIKMARDKKFLGYFVFEIEDSDVIIIEKFFDLDGETPVPSNNAATYIVHKDVELDLEKLQNASQLVAKKKENTDGPKLLRSVNHRGTGYYDRLLTRFEEVEKAGEINKENQEIDNIEISQEEKSDETIENSENISEITDGKSDSTQDNSQQLLQEMIGLDEKYEMIKKEIEKLEIEKQSITEKIAYIKEQSAQKLDEILTSDIIEVIQKQLEIIKLENERLNGIEKLIQNLREIEKRNREERDKLSKEFKSNIIGGE